MVLVILLHMRKLRQRHYVICPVLCSSQQQGWGIWLKSSLFKQHIIPHYLCILVQVDLNIDPLVYHSNSSSFSLLDPFRFISYVSRLFHTDPRLWTKWDWPLPHTSWTFFTSQFYKSYCLNVKRSHLLRSDKHLLINYYIPKTMLLYLHNYIMCAIMCNNTYR